LHDVLKAFLANNPVDQIIVTECGEHRLHQQMLETWPAILGMEPTIVDDSRFICSKAEFAQWAQGRKQLRMEYFYRDMRRKTGLLMAADQPVGDQWNFDSSNREPYRGDPVVPIQIPFTRDDIDKEVLNLVAREFSSHPGTLTHFNWPTTREQALQALDSFINTRLRWYGDYQDAMQQSQHFMFHSLISTSLNCGLLTPLEVCRAAHQAWQDNKAPLNAVEGFIRQIIGWREFIRGIYWLTMPGYAAKNFLNKTRDLPDFYWTGETRMACMKACFKNTFDHAYAHHIQRLMVTGNFALLAGITPSQVCDWYLAVYADAYDWVELPNTLGMVMHADGVRAAVGFWAYHALDLAVLAALACLAIRLYNQWGMSIWSHRLQRRFWWCLVGLLVVVWEATEVGYAVGRGTWGYEHIAFADVVSITLSGAGVYVLHAVRVVVGAALLLW
jgi:deoxyribodipyrimidine photolyase-related protein